MRLLSNSSNFTKNSIGEKEAIAYVKGISMRGHIFTEKFIRNFGDV